MPNTIAQNLQRLIAAKTAIAGAITAKGGTVGQSDGLEDFASDIDSIPSGGGGGEEGKIRLIDYDGTVLHTYTQTQFANLSSLPANPSHTGLIAYGWNWTLADAKTYVANYASLDIGQMYGLDQGFINMRIHLAEGRLNPSIGLCFEGTIQIDWGDGSGLEDVESDGSSNTFVPHIYTDPGDYVIAITTDSCEFVTFINVGDSCALLCKKSGDVNGSKVYINSICGLNIDDSNVGIITIRDCAFYYCYSLTSVTIPFSVTTIDANAFRNCCSLTSITIPDGVTSIGNHAFDDCCSLASITIPSSVTSIGTHAFQYCRSLTSITIPSGVKTIGQSAFNACYSLASITIPSGVTSIGNYAFNACYSLTSITIPSGVTSISQFAFTDCRSLTSITIPSGVTTISQNAFQYCCSLASITIPSGVKTIGGSAFSGCYSLASITIPSSVTSIGSGVFRSCYSLASITIPSSVTTIGQYMFGDCYSLASITIPDGVTSISSYAFSNCYGLSFVRFERNTPPTVNSSSVWSEIPTDCIIYAPALVLNLYMDKTNYPAKATYAYVGYATYESGETLPTLTTDETYTLTWYATSNDAIAQTNPITVGNGHEVYARATAV